MQKQQIKNIIFDLGNILVDVDYKRFTDAMDWDYDKFMSFFNSEFFREFEIGKHSEEMFFVELNKHMPLKEGDEQRYRDNIHKTFSLRPRTWAKVHWLKKHYKIILFSNTNSLDYNALDKIIDLKRVIRSSYVSHAQGYIKPDPRSYQCLVELFNIEPAESLFVDDLKENIDGAKKAGWNAELIDSEARLFEVLEKYQIN
ncbi:MAG: HAD-IA family hydrolase [Candidatus Marinimicrobia bacterium]|nr:HAD-IA family hydrolase [Candidatus Neomarinimicrobiota bacterium]